jgi:glycosyltransferase involved in cell wall biosynthesis
MADLAGVEVLIPAYNAASTLRATLRSVIGQTVPIGSATVIDDLSTDGTAGIAQSFAGVRYIRNDRNLGCSGNWNRCLDVAKSDYVCLLHADDLLAPDWHASVQKDIRLAEAPLETAYYLGAARFEDVGRVVEALSFADRAGVYGPGALLRLLWRHHFYGLTTSACMVYGRVLLTRLGRFPGREYPNMADVPFHWELLLDHPIVYDPALLALIRRGAPNQIGATRKPELAIGALRSFQAVARRIAVVMGQSVDDVTVSYLFPYWVMSLRDRLRGRSEVPGEVVDAFRAALSRSGGASLVGTAIRELTNRARRYTLKREWARSVERIVAGVSGRDEREE